MREAIPMRKITSTKDPRTIGRILDIVREPIWYDSTRFKRFVGRLRANTAKKAPVDKLSADAREVVLGLKDSLLDQSTVTIAD
jgi:hypothetical protein